MRSAAALSSVLALAAALAGCAGGNAHEKPRLAKQNQLSAIKTVHGGLRNVHSGAPLNGILVSGTITNTESTPLHCIPSAFLLIDASGNATTPASQWCDVPSIAPQQSAIFNAAFPASSSKPVQLRFLHSDGSYEVHEVDLPPA